MLSQLWLLLLLSLLTLQGPQPSTGMGYKTQSNVELLENDSRYISYQGRFHSRWGLSKITRNCVNCKAINQVGHLRTVRTVNWVDVSQSSKWGFESLHSIAQCSVNRCHSILSTHLPTCWLLVGIPTMISVKKNSPTSRFYDTPIHPCICCF